jgi:hypothetical protein
VIISLLCSFAPLADNLGPCKLFYFNVRQTQLPCNGQLNARIHRPLNDVNEETRMPKPLGWSEEIRETKRGLSARPDEHLQMHEIIKASE